MQNKNMCQQEYCLNEYQYEQVKESNQRGYEILRESINMMREMFKEETYITKPIKLSKQIGNMSVFCELYHQTLEMVLETSEKMQTEKNNGDKAMLRCYYKKDHELIMDIASHYEDILLCMTVSMKQNLTHEGNKELKEIIKKAEAEITELKETLKKIHVSSTIGFRVIRILNMKAKITGG